MKKFSRCNVCNDIHYGLKPPELCPTCLAMNAYVEISSEEAGKIMAATKTTINREQFVRAITAFTEKNEFEINHDKARVGMLLDGIMANEQNHGLKYCPCRLATGDFAEDLKLVCPCNFGIHETYKGKPDGECWCSLFVRRRS
jgi:ferredoxin-thioredoxin reductase catalytic chain